MKSSFTIICITLLLLSGCKATVETKVSLKDILNSKTKNIDGNLYVEVAACSSYEDSRKPSNSLIKATETIPSIFSDANYIECFKKKFDSFAHFSVPIVLDKDRDGKFASEKHINIVSNDKVLLSVDIPPAIKKNMERVKMNSYGS